MAEPKVIQIKKHAPFVTSIDTRKLYETISCANEEEVITHSALSESIGRDVRDEAYGALASAVKMAKRQGVYFLPVRGVGIRRVTHKEWASVTGDDKAAHIRRTSRTWIRDAAGIDVASLDAESRVKFHLNQTLHSFIAHETSAPRLNRMEQIVRDAGEALPLGKTLEAFKK